jgi:uncharacterized protein YndB with AHSA1/START domain
MNAGTSVRRLTVRQQIAAPPSELFDDWLDPAKMVAWMRPGDTKRSKIKIDPRVGGKLEVLMQTGQGEVPHTGAYKVIDRPRHLTFTWNSPAAGNRDSLVTIDFKPVGNGTEVVLTHDNLPSEEEVEAHTKGWTRILKLMSETHAEAA